jgi:DNA-binding response OmpR family regulator
VSASAHEHICPHCGFDLVKNGPVIIDNWSMLGPGYPLCYEGRPISLTRSESELVYTLLKAFPRHVDRWVLLDRLGSESEQVNLLAVYVTRIKARLKGVGLKSPIATVWGHGYRWMREGEDDEAKTSDPKRAAPERAGGRPRKPKH